MRLHLFKGSLVTVLLKIISLFLAVFIILVTVQCILDYIHQENNNIKIKQDIINIDYSLKGTPLTHVALGFIHTPDIEIPTNENLEKLKPKFFRNQPNLAINSAKRIKSMGAVNEMVLSDGWGYKKGNLPNNDWSKWELYIQNILSKTNNSGYQFRYDIWNEPDHSFFWSESEEKFFEMWKRTFIQIKKQDRNSMIVGPSFAKFDIEKLKRFIKFANGNKVLPDILSLHENDLTDSVNLINHIKDIRSYLYENGINKLDIEINEYGAEQRQLDSFSVIKNFSLLEQANISNAARSCWNEDIFVSGCSPKMLNGLLTTKGEPRSIWWAYKFYSQMKGTLLGDSSTNVTHIISSTDANKGYILLSPNADIDNITFNINKIGVNFAHNLDISVYKIDSSDTKSAELTTINQYNQLIDTNLVISLYSAKRNDIYFIIIGNKNISEKP